MKLAAAYRIDALPRKFLHRVWTTGHDDLGNKVEIMVNDEENSAPLRCCLTEAPVGEKVALVAYQPFDRPGPYAETGPVLIHVEPCAGYADIHRYPEEFRHRRQILRAYDARGWQAYDAHTIVDGEDAEAVIERILANPNIEFLHSRNVLAGCYMFTIRRP